MTIVDDPPYDPRYDDPEDAPPPRRAPTSAPPHDADAETGLLGTMLASLEACDLVIEAGVEPEHFYLPRHGDIYDAITKALGAGEVPDPVTVHARLPSGTNVTGPDLLSLLAHAPVWSNASAYARRIQHTHRLRRLQGAATAVADRARASDLDGALREIEQLTAALPADQTTSTWTAVDLTAALDGNGPPQPTLLARDDGICLLYAGKVHAFNAESESGKSWLALAAVAGELHDGHHALYIDFEDDDTGIVGRLQALGLDRDTIISRFHYVRPDDPIDAVSTAALERLLLDHQPTIAIIDGVTEVMAQNGWSITDNDDAAKFLLALPRRIARHGPAVVLIDHVTKDKEGRGRYGIGAAHKLAGLDGAAYHLEVSTPFGIGRQGASRITVTKDRPGHVRGAAIEGRFIGELRLDSLPGGAVHLSLSAHADAANSRPQVRPTNLMEQVSKNVQEMNEAGLEPTKSAVANDVPSTKAKVLLAIDWLIEESYLTTTPGPKRAQNLRSIKPYRAVLDPRSDVYAGGDGEPPEDF